MKRISSTSAAFWLSLSLGLSACGGSSSPGNPGDTSGGGTSGGEDSGDIAGAPVGIGGTGIGTITGFGSVFINDIRHFEIDGKTKIIIDGEDVAEIELRDRGQGLVTQVNVSTDVNDDFTQGTALSIRADNRVKGPVTSTSPLQILGQTIVVTGDTFLVDLTGNSAASLITGDIAEVSGFADNNHVIQATRLQRKAAGIPVWKLTGTVTGLQDGGFNIGAQSVQFGSVIPRDCGAGLKTGDLVEVKANSDAGFIPGAALTTVTDIECQSGGLNIPDNSASSGTLKAEVEGIITRLTSTTAFEVNSQKITTNNATLFEGGNPSDLITGVRLEAEGSLDLQSGILAAKKIRFRQSRVRIEAPLEVPATGLGSSFTMMEVINISTLANTRDDDQLLSGPNGKDTGRIQVEVRGFVDKDGKVFAERVRERGNADASDVRLRGPISSPANPNFKILGVSVDTTTATSIRDSGGAPITATSFFNLASEGSLVQVEDGLLQNTPPRISNGKIELED